VLPAPEILGIEPAEGPSSGGTAVVIRGRGFHGAATATLGGAPLVAIEVPSPEEIHASTPPGGSGAADLEVMTAGGQALLAGAFTYIDSYARGDANGDGNRDVSDAVAILAFLFQGGEAPPCLPVADSNEDAEVDIADAVFLLLYLFAGGAAPGSEPIRCSN
jgi:hypothetical protein